MKSRHLPAAKRAQREALLRTVHELRLSVARGRAISLPNCLRLYRRHASRLGQPQAVAGLESIRRLYRDQQPFASRKVHLRK